MGRKFVDQPAKQGVDILEDGADALFLALGRDFQCTVMQQTAATAVALDDSVAGGACGCRIYAEYAETYIRGSGARCWACRLHRTKSTAFLGLRLELCREVFGKRKTCIPLPGDGR